MTISIGIDESKWAARPLDWIKASSVVSFAYIKASDGISEDPLFRPQWDAARIAAREGLLLRGGYLYFRPAIDPDEQARKMVELLGPDPGELPPAWDVESTGGRSDTLARLKTSMARFEQLSGLRPIIYSGGPFLHSIGADRTFLGIYLERWLLNYELWFAAYPGDYIEPESARAAWINQVMTGERTLKYPNSPGPWKNKPLFYQWTSRADPAKIPGYYTGVGSKKAVDLNFSRLTKEELFARFAGSLPSDGDISMPDYVYSITPSTSDGSRVRSDHYV
jgi:hypothetical protein